MLVRSIYPDEYEAVLDLWDRAFTHTPREYFRRYFEGDPWFKPKYCRVCVDNDQLVSIVQICPREVRFGSGRLIMGGIANVGTPPESQHKGYASAAMRDSVEVMKADGMDFSILLTGINQFYERFGYDTIELNYKVSRPKRRIPVVKTDHTIRPYCLEDAPDVVNIYNHFYSDVILSAVRTVDYWVDFVTNPKSSHYDIWVAEAGGELAAYLIGQPYGKTYSISEIACAGGREDAIIPLAQAVWQRIKQLKTVEINYMLPDKPEINQAVSTIAEPPEIRTSTNTMFAILNLRAMMEKMLPELSRRIKSSGLDYSGCLTISCRGELVTLLVSPDGVRITDEHSENPVELNHKDLCSIVFGYKGAFSIFPENQLLAVLFPRCDSLYSSVDGF